ncbi:hypothetical protein BCV70DRAFT_197344 [Testicularia cyperi]|uniref:Uncharacterized protein n=1 Tax=Testicularia cyperi TaxID=1882483 RepID=A0A317XYU2_9BASI|nr:hypothetical protein BCV70DRAFT_197344 [Testicularia cyperi]
MSRFAGRFLPNIENEVRRQAIEPINKWRQEWVLPPGVTSDTASTVRILKWIKVPDAQIHFPEEEDVQAHDRIQNDAAIVEAPVQSIHNAPAEPAAKLSVGGGLGTIAPKEPPAPAPASASASSAIPANTGTAVAAPSSSVDIASAIPAHVTQSHTEPNSETSTTGNVTPAAVSPQPSSQGLGASGAQTPQFQPQIEAQLHNQLDGANDKATLAVLAAAGDHIAAERVEEVTDAQAPGQPHLSIEPGSEAGLKDEIPAEQSQQPVVQPSEDVEMKDD